jgi:16S rRNA (guanine966-N2)-methyltransferase
VGLELLSRGAASAVFVESDRAASAALERNLRIAGEGRTRRLALHAGRALSRLAADGERFDLLFVDPPYEDELPKAFGEGVASVAGEGALLAVERRAREALELEGSWRRLESRRYGDAELHLFARE